MKQVYSCKRILNKISNFLVPLVITISLFYSISVVCSWRNIFHIQKWYVAKYLKEWTELCKGNTPFQNYCSNVSYMKGTNMWPNKQAKRDGGGYLPFFEIRRCSQQVPNEILGQSNKLKDLSNAIILTNLQLTWRKRRDYHDFSH